MLAVLQNNTLLTSWKTFRNFHRKKRKTKRRLPLELPCSKIDRD